MKLTQAIAVVLFGALLTGCATSAAPPTTVQPLATAQRTGLHISEITADAADGIEMSDGDFDVVCKKIRIIAAAEAPGIFVDGGHGLKMHIHFTRFDRGSAFARAMLIGLGQIRIEATVTLIDASGATVAEYAVSKDFAIGGVIGASTTVGNVETGLARSIVEFVKH